jgi:hypothetical protein
MSERLGLTEETVATLAIISAMIMAMTWFTVDLSGLDRYVTVIGSGVVAAVAFLLANAVIARYHSSPEPQ